MLAEKYGSRATYWQDKMRTGRELRRNTARGRRLRKNLLPREKRENGGSGILMVKLCRRQG